jgi:hypothetical protein
LRVFAPLSHRPATKQDLELLRRDIDNRFSLAEQKIDTLRSDITRDLAAIDLRMTIKLGSLIAAGSGLTIAALRLWS